ncbi:hypothetical protein ACTOB_001558 [Actinoplanes oblitus]|uniref:Uncharacterized protein n=1 Tax=Actinoplanes oblitus TaxID=3040509 RepID=A0ABY8WJJ9_9ACTN|nr:hypothetical protein [Actinoplanes oblitus]WIM97990.1 hypothetical protein ACTOB_001558 [Actinoplanes oblitus]
MTRRKFTPEELSGFALHALETATPGDRWVRRAIADFFLALVDLHEATPDGQLPGGEFLPAVVVQLERLRSDVAMAVVYQIDEIDEAGWERRAEALRVRSALQYLKEDFVGTSMAELVDAETLADADVAIRELIGEHGPADAEDVPAFVPVSHWWWDSSFRAAMPDWVTVYRIGEAPDDLRPAFHIVDRAYPRPWLAEAAREEASKALSERGIIRSLSGFEGSSGYSGDGLPTWEEFRQRHFVEGVPLPVRSVPRDYEPPSGVDAMRAEIRREGSAVLAELESIAGEAFPGSPTQLNSIDGPLRMSPASVYQHEELWGFRISFMVFPEFPADVPPADEIAALAPVLTARGWSVGPTLEKAGKLEVDVSRGELLLHIFAEPGAVTCHVVSPRYRAPDEPGATWVIEPRS